MQRGMVLLAAVGLFASWSVSAAADESQSHWYKGNLHTHSLWSDGNDFPEMIVDWYVEEGYDFLALSDHNILSKGEKWMDIRTIHQRGGEDALEQYRERFGEEWVETRGDREGEPLEVRLRPLDEFRGKFEEPGEFLLIQSEEISDGFERLPIHLNATNIQEVIMPQGGDSVRDTIDNNLRAVAEQAERTGQTILPHLNHPNFHYAITAEDIAAVIAERFFEVYNGHPGVRHTGDHHHPGVERMWDIANTIRIADLGEAPLYGLATDDSHNYHEDEPVMGRAQSGRGWIMVRADELAVEPLLKAMQAGDFYASSGVTLKDVRYTPDAKTLELEIEPEGDATYTTHFIGTLADYDDRSEPRTDEDGEPIRSTRKYSEDVGKVLATVEGTEARYELTGEELYVRAVVTSSEVPENPSFEGQKKQAWTQPVGWRGWMDED